MTEKRIKYTFLVSMVAMAVVMSIWLIVTIDVSVRDLPWSTILTFFVMVGFEVLALEYIFTRIRSWKIGIIRVLPIPIMFIICMVLGKNYLYWFLPAAAIIKIIIDAIIYWWIYEKKTLTTDN